MCECVLSIHTSHHMWVREKYSTYLAGSPMENKSVIKMVLHAIFFIVREITTVYSINASMNIFS